MTPFLLLTLWLAAIVFSIWAHEAAHVGVAVGLGWRYGGWAFKPKALGVGVELEPPGGTPKGNDLWRIAYAGLLCTAALALGFAAAAHVEPTFRSLAWFNLVLLLCNAIPMPITDGGYVLRGLLGWQVRWRHTLALWVAVELLVAYFLLT